MAEDNELKEAIEACAKIIEEKCGHRPYMIVISKANVKYANEQHEKKGILTGTATYMYMAKPKLKKDGLSKLLIDTSQVALNLAKKNIQEEAASSA